MFTAEPTGARFSLRLRPAQVPAEAAGFRLNLPVNRWHGTETRFAARLGPDEWLLGAPGEAGALAQAIGAALGGQPHALVDISSRHLAFTVAGPDGERVLNAGCPLDLHPSEFPVGMATRTLLGKADIILRRTDRDRFLLECWRSFAPYAASFLNTAALDAAP